MKCFNICNEINLVLNFNGILRKNSYCSGAEDHRFQVGYNSCTAIKENFISLRNEENYSLKRQEEDDYKFSSSSSRKLLLESVLPSWSAKNSSNSELSFASKWCTCLEEKCPLAVTVVALFGLLFPLGGLILATHLNKKDIFVVI